MSTSVFTNQPDLVPGIDISVVKAMLDDTVTEGPIYSGGVTDLDFIEAGNTLRLAAEDSDSVKELTTRLEKITAAAQQASEKKSDKAKLFVAEQLRVRKALDKERRRVLRQLLSQIRPMGGELKTTGTIAPVLRSALNNNISLFPTVWVDEASKRIIRVKQLKPTLRGRSYFDSGKNELALNGSEPAVMAHELAHLMEKAVPDIARAEKAFWQRRTGNRSYVRISSNEVAIPDDFTRPYMGKRYNRDTSWEILSMGIEGVMYGKYELLENDPEFFDFVLGLLAKI